LKFIHEADVGCTQEAGLGFPAELLGFAQMQCCLPPRAASISGGCSSFRKLLLVSRIRIPIYAQQLCSSLLAVGLGSATALHWVAWQALYSSTSIEIGKHCRAHWFVCDSFPKLSRLLTPRSLTTARVLHYTLCILDQFRGYYHGPIRLADDAPAKLPCYVMRPNSFIGRMNTGDR
jgi:hypothetical protein